MKSKITSRHIQQAHTVYDGIEKGRALEPASLSSTVNTDTLKQWIDKTVESFSSDCSDPVTRADLQSWIQESNNQPDSIISKLIALSSTVVPFPYDKFTIYQNAELTISGILNPMQQAIDDFHMEEEISRVENNEDPASVMSDYTGEPVQAAADPESLDFLLDKLKAIRPELHRDIFPLVDIGYSRLFTEIYKDNCRYNSTAKCWYFYDGIRWVKDGDGKQVEALAKTFYDGLCKYITSGVFDDPETQAAYMKEISKLGRFNPRITVIKDAASNKFFSYEDLDKDGDLFNCQNGVFNLRTMTFTPGHDPEQMLSKVSNVIYDPSASSEVWEKFMNEIMMGDQEKIDYIQKTLGYALTTDTSEECLWFWHGEKSRNGKSTTAETLSYMMGGDKGYAAAVDPETLAEKKYKNSSAPNGDIACLEGCRFLNVSEPPKNMLFNAALVKKMTGGNMIKARDLMEKFHEYKPQYKIFIDTNYLPVIVDDTLFLSGRVIVITFDRVFSEEEQDHTLKARLQRPENISGLFNWCLRGLQRYRTEGLKKPASIREATETYKSNSDKISLFMSDCLVKNPSGNVTAAAAYTAYKQWCYECGYSPEGKMNFQAALRKKNLLLANATVNGQHHHNVIPGYSLPAIPQA